MKTQKITTVSVIGVALLMLVTFSSYAQRGKEYGAQTRNLERNPVCQMIPDLTEEQQATIETLRVGHLKEMNTFRNEMNELRAKKQTLMASDNADLKEINVVIDQMTEVHNKMMKVSAKHQQDVRGLLTDKQKVYFDSRPMHGHKHGKGMRHARSGRGEVRAHGRGVN